MAYDSFSNNDFEKFVVRLKEESDRGLALIAASALDFELGQLLRKTVVDNKKIADDIFGTSRPLSSFSSRIDISYLLGKISSEEHHELHLIRKIRNDFGHSFENISFSDQKINNILDNFKLCVTIDTPNRDKFTLSTAYLLGRLNNLINNAEHITEAQRENVFPGKKSYDEIN